MNQETTKKFGLEIGQKVLYPHQIGSNYGAPIHLQVVTIKDVTMNYNDELIILVKEFEGYISYTDIYTFDQIKKMFNTYDFEVWKNIVPEP